MNKLDIAVLRGGPSSEYDVSLKSGAAVLQAFADDDSYRLHDIFVDKTEQWHRNGIAMPPSQALKGIDAAIIAMHGAYGEDGTVQRLLEQIGIPYTGTRAYASALAMHKPRTRFQVAALPMLKFPEHYVVREDDISTDAPIADFARIAQDIFQRFGPPYIVKPAAGGSSVGLTIAKTIAELPYALSHVAEATGYPILVEQFIRGKETTCGVVEGFRGHNYYALPPIEIAHQKGKDLFDYDAKYSDNTQVCSSYICPATFTKDEKQHIEEAAKAVHQALDLNHYSRTDFILTPNGLYFLEVNTLPGLTSHSLLPTSLNAVGSNLKEFFTHAIDLALEKK